MSAHLDAKPTVAPEPRGLQRRWPRGVLYLLAAGVALRVLFFLIATNNGGDAIDRMLKTQTWMEQPTWQFFFGQWLPLHFWMMAALSKLIGSLWVGGRLLSLILGIASLPLLYGMVRDLFGRRAALLSLIICSFYSLHVGYSTTSSSEMPYLFFVIAGLNRFVAYRRDGSLRSLTLSAFCLTCAAGIRYEAWVFIFGIALLLIGSPRRVLTPSFWQQENIHALLTFGIVAGSFPIASMLVSWRLTGHPLRWALNNAACVAEQRAWSQTSDAYRLAVTPGVLLVTLTLPVIAAAGYALLRIWRRGPGRELAWLILLFAFFQCYQIISGGLLPLARYTITLGTLMAALAGYGLCQAALRLPAAFQQRLPAALTVLMVANLAMILSLSETRNPVDDKFASISPTLRFRRHIEDVGDYLRARLGPDDRIVVDNHNAESTLVCLAAGLPQDPKARSFRASSQPPGQVLNYIREQHPRFVVYSDRGTLRPYLAKPRDCSRDVIHDGVRVRCAYSNDVYHVYELIYPSQAHTPAAPANTQERRIAGRIANEPMPAQRR